MTPRVLYFGTFDRGVGRNAILQAGLAAAGVPVASCHRAVWADTAAKLEAVRSTGDTLRAVARLAAAWPFLARCHARSAPADVLLVGATAHLDLPLAHWLARRRAQLLVFDPLVSIGETVRDRGLLAPSSRRLAALGRAERALFALADLCLVDSASHGQALSADVGLAPDRTVVLPVGAPASYRTGVAEYRPRPDDAGLRVVYFGQFIPLHGLDTVIDAAARLRHRPDISFELVGLGQTLPAIASRAAALDLPAVRFVRSWLSAEDLQRAHIAPADVCLGVFGGQPKAQHIVPYKVYAALAAGRAVVTADTPAVRELLVPGSEVCTVPSQDPAALAAALTRLADEPALRLRLATAGRAAYDARFAPAVLGERLRAALVRALAERGANARAA